MLAENAKLCLDLISVAIHVIRLTGEMTVPSVPGPLGASCAPIIYLPTPVWARLGTTCPVAMLFSITTPFSFFPASQLALGLLGALQYHPAFAMGSCTFARISPVSIQSGLFDTTYSPGTRQDRYRDLVSSKRRFCSWSGLSCSLGGSNNSNKHWGQAARRCSIHPHSNNSSHPNCHSSLHLILDRMAILLLQLTCIQ